MIYNEEFETLPREALEALQVKRLQQVVQRVYHTVGLYKRTFDNAGIKPITTSAGSCRHPGLRAESAASRTSSRNLAPKGPRF